MCVLGCFVPLLYGSPSCASELREVAFLHVAPATSALPLKIFALAEPTYVRFAAQFCATYA